METTVFLDTVNLHRFFYIYVWVLERSNPGWNATLATLEILRARFTLWDVSQCTKVSGTVHKHAPRAMVWQEVLNSKWITHFNHTIYFVLNPECTTYLYNIYSQLFCVSGFHSLWESLLLLHRCILYLTVSNSKTCTVLFDLCMLVPFSQIHI